MKDKFTYILVLLLLVGVAFLVGRCTKKPVEVEVVQVDTVTIYDTTFIDKPYPVTEKVVKTIYIPVTDTLRMHDTTFVALPRTQKEYSDSLYRAWVSGFQPNLDSIAIFQKTQYITKTVSVPRLPKMAISPDVSALGGPGMFFLGAGAKLDMWAGNWRLSPGVDYGLIWNGGKWTHGPVVTVSANYNFIIK